MGTRTRVGQSVERQVEQQVEQSVGQSVEQQVEQDVVTMLTNGCTVQEIAKRLDIREISTGDFPEGLRETSVKIDPRLRTVLGKFKTFRWPLRGITVCHTGFIVLNSALLQDKRHLCDTIRHEVAHAWNYIGWGTVGHGARWRSLAKMLGHKGNRCSSSEKFEDLRINVARRAWKVVGVCKGCEIEIMGRRKLARGRVWRHRACGAVILTD